ncbi:hypothetical protein WBG78_05415 [Chryseolinea sp. T2]|uniref:hypothetical protein n=1 Tax=Chryseolinea sp. T2 TaxID=3129255 RepID=UPI00307777F2
MFRSVRIGWIIGVTVWLCCFSTTAIHAQADANTGGRSAPITSEITQPNLAVKWSLLHLFYFYPSVQFSLEQKLFRDFGIQYEGGWVIRSYENPLDYEDKRGFRGAIELRYYFHPSPMVPFYISGEYYYHSIRFNRTETVGFNCDTGMCDYYQSVTYPVHVEEMGPAIKFGMLMFPGWKHNRRFFFDINSGIAFRNINYSYKARPVGENIRYFDDSPHWRPFAPNEELSNKTRFVLGARLGFRFL